MELNKYDLAEWVSLFLKAVICEIGVICEDCPIREECNKTSGFTCFDEDETKELLMKKYNL
jgi:hypothetical protein